MFCNIMQSDVNKMFLLSSSYRKKCIERKEVAHFFYHSSPEHFSALREYDDNPPPGARGVSINQIRFRLVGSGFGSPRFGPLQRPGRLRSRRCRSIASLCKLTRICAISTATNVAATVAAVAEVASVAASASSALKEA